MLFCISEKYKESGNVRRSSDLQSVLPPAHRHSPCPLTRARACAFVLRAQCRLEAQYSYQREVPMVPLKMQEDYAPNGWLGLLLGASLWHAFWDAVELDDASFEARLDKLCAEIGSRGKPKGSQAKPPPLTEEGVPPAVVTGVARAPAARAAAPAPAWSPAPAPASSSSSAAGAAAATPSRVTAAAAPTGSNQDGHSSFTPSMQQLSSPAQTSGLDDVSSTCSNSTLITLMLEREEQLRAQAKSERDELQEQIQALERRLAPEAAFTDEQLSMFQARMTGLHSADLLSSELFHGIEDTCADAIELASSVRGGVLTVDMAATNEMVAKLRKLIVLSERLDVDASLARQIRRKLAQ
jgi:hypothetical protein